MFREREEEGRGQRGRERGQGGRGEVIKGRKFVTKVEMRGGEGEGRGDTSAFYAITQF